MSEAYTYGGNGSLRRFEYSKPNQQDLDMYVDMVSDQLESIFLCDQPMPGIEYTFEQTDEKLCQNIDISYITKASPVLTSARITYIKNENGALREEYIVSIARSDIGIKGDFCNRYHLCRFAGNNWQANVSHNDIENDDYNIIKLENNSKYYSREMTPYDFDEFFEDTGEINTQLRMRLVQ